MRRSGSEARWSDVVVLVCVSLLVSGVAALVSEVISRDGATFVELARHARAGRFGQVLAHNQHPLLPMIVADVGGLFQLETEVAGRVVCVASKALAAIPLYLLLALIMGRRRALGAGLLFAVLPRIVHYSADVLTDAPALCLVLWALYLGYVLLTTQKVALAAVVGVLAGLAYLTRPEGGAPCVIFLVAGALGAVRRPMRRIPVFVAQGLVMCAVLAVVIAPYVIYLRTETGGWTLSKKKNPSEFLNTTRIREEAERDVAGGISGDTGGDVFQAAESVRGAVFDRQRRALGACFKNFSEALFHGPLFFAVVGLLWRAKVHRRRGEGFLLLSTGFYLALAFLLAQLTGPDYLSIRHVQAAAALSLGWSVVGMEETGYLLAGLAGRERRGKVAGVVLGVLIIVLLVLMGAKAMTHTKREIVGLKRAGLWIRGEMGAGRRIGAFAMARAPYYARGKHVNLALRREVVDSFDGVMTVLRKERLDVVVIDTEKIYGYAGDFMQRVEGGMLTLAHTEQKDPDNPGVQIRVYVPGGAASRPVGADRGGDSGGR